MTQRNSEPNLEVLSNFSYSQISPNPQKSSYLMLCCLRPDPERCVIQIIHVLLLILFPIEELSCLELPGHMFLCFQDYLENHVGFVVVYGPCHPESQRTSFFILNFFNYLACKVFSFSLPHWPASKSIIRDAHEIIKLRKFKSCGFLYCVYFPASLYVCANPDFSFLWRTSSSTSFTSGLYLSQIPQLNPLTVRKIFNMASDRDKEKSV